VGKLFNYELHAPSTPGTTPHPLEDCIRISLVNTSL